MVNWEYIVVWSLYLLAGSGLTYIWWRITRPLRLFGLRAVLRGTLVVLIFTPWFAGESITHYAPAFLVLAFDLLFVDTSREYISGYALIASFCFMLVLLAALQLRKK
jgi:hypothetical protein